MFQGDGDRLVDMGWPGVPSLSNSFFLIQFKTRFFVKYITEKCSGSEPKTACFLLLFHQEGSIGLQPGVLSPAWGPPQSDRFPTIIYEHPAHIEAFRIFVLLLISLGRIKTSPVKRTYRPSCLHRPTRSLKASVLVSNSPDTPVSSCLPGCLVLARQDPEPGVVTEFHLLSSVSLFVIPSVDSNLEVPDQGFLYQNFQLLIPNLRHQIKVSLPCWLTPNI